MERVQILGPNVRRCLLSIVCLLLLVSCASKKFIDVDKTEFLKEEEYDSVIAIQPDPSSVPKQSNADTASPTKEDQGDSKSKDIPQNEIKQDIKKPLKKKKMLIKNKKEKKKEEVKLIPTKTALKGNRLPEIEDSQGFEGRRPKIDPFKVGEEVNLDVKYLGVVAGTLVLKVMPFVQVNGRKAYHFRVSVKSNSSFSMFFKVDDWSDSYVDYETLLPFNYTTHVDHSNEKKEIKVLLDHTKNLVKIWEKKIDSSGSMKKKNHEWDMVAFSQNVISIFFYIRNFQFEAGKTLSIPMTDEDNNMMLEAKILHKEKIKTDLGEFDTFVVEPKASVKGKFKQTGEVKLWFTDDDRKMIVKVVADLQIGSLQFVLKKIVLSSNE